MTIDEIIAEVLSDKYFAETYDRLTKEQVSEGVERVKRAMVEDFLRHANHEYFIPEK